MKNTYYYYEPWVSVVYNVEDEEVTGIIDEDDNVYTYDRIIDCEGEISHRWIKESDGSYWYTEFRVPLINCNWCQIQDEPFPPRE